MSNLSITMPHGYLEACTTLGARNTKKLGPNTYLEKHEAQAIGGMVLAIRYHETAIIKYRPDGSWSLNNGGFFTSTTKERLKLFLWRHGLSLFQHKKVWRVRITACPEIEIPYFNGFSSDDAARLKNMYITGLKAQQDNR